MNTRKSPIHLLASLLGLVCPAGAAVSLVGVDTTAGAYWRTGANLDVDSQYGTSGYAIFGINAPDSTFVYLYGATPGYSFYYDVGPGNPFNAYNLPAGVGVSTADSNFAMWSGNGNFGMMEDPLGGVTAAPVLAFSTGPKQWTINRSVAQGFRLTIMTASGDNQGTQYDLSLNDGSGPASSSWDHVANGLAYHVYDVTAGTTPIVLNVTSTLEDRQITGIAFDPIPIPEPSSALMGGLAALGLLRRQRGNR